MTPIETLRTQLSQSFPKAAISLSPPLLPDGVWALDFDLADTHLAIEWDAKIGFGLSSVGASTYGEAVDEVVETLSETERRVAELVDKKASTSPPLNVLLKRVRESRGLTQRQVATKLGIRQATLSVMERRHDLQLSTLRRIVEALGGVVEVFARFGSIRYRLFDSGQPRKSKSAEGELERLNYHFTCLESMGHLAPAYRQAAVIRDRGAVIPIPP